MIFLQVAEADRLAAACAKADAVGAAHIGQTVDCFAYPLGPDGYAIRHSAGGWDRRLGGRDR